MRARDLPVMDRLMRDLEDDPNRSRACAPSARSRNVGRRTAAAVARRNIERDPPRDGERALDHRAETRASARAIIQTDSAINAATARK